MTFSSFLAHTSLVGLVTIVVLIGCSIYVVAVGRELQLRLRSAHLPGDWLLTQLYHLQQAKKQPKAVVRDYLQRHPQPLARMLSQLLCLDAPVDLERGDYLLSTAIERERSELERGLPGLGTVAVIAPFVGLFGTVVGIAKTFSDIAGMGKAGIEVVSAGVSEALVATGIGLVVAIASVVLFNALKSRIETRVGEWDAISRTYLSLLAASPEEAEKLWAVQPQPAATSEDAQSFLAEFQQKT